MFGFGSQRARKAQLEVGVLLRRLLNNSVPRVPQETEESRTASRCMRCLPVVLVPWKGGGPLTTQAAFGTTKEVSDHGLAVVLPIQPQETEVGIGLLVDGEPRFLRGQIKHCTAIGGGYWQVGIHALELIDPSTPEWNNLLPFARHLVPALDADIATLWR
jgi:hypothetical protein